jgi:aryl-alcohol dehydrogenase-like predicted oxidoreductase
MKKVAFGKTGEKVSEMCLGTMMFGERCDQAESDRILAAAMEAGVNFVDTAPIYAGGRTEQILGHILQGRRDKLFLVSKVRIDMLGVLESIEQSLQRLQTDYLDLYLIHAPTRGMDPVQIMRDLDQVVKQGKARFVGCSNYPAWLVSHSNCIAQQHGWPELVCNQVPFSLIERPADIEVLQQAYTQNLAIMAYRPMCLGLLAGKYTPGEPLPEDSRATTDKRIAWLLDDFGEAISGLLDMARQREVPPATMALAWLRANPGITTPIVGVSSLRQLQSNLAAFEFDLTDEEYQKLDKMFALRDIPSEITPFFQPFRRDLYLVQREP